MIKTSIAEVSRVTGKSARHVRNLCKEGKLPCEKIKINTGEKYMVYLRTPGFKELFGDIPLSEFREYEEDEINLKDVTSFPLPSSSIQEGSPSFLEEGSKEIFIDNEDYKEHAPTSQISTIVETLTQRIEFLAKEAGKTELLTDNLMTSNENVKFYQDEYFKIRHELESTEKELSQANSTIATLQGHIQKLEQELVELKNKLKKPFWSRF